MRLLSFALTALIVVVMILFFGRVREDAGELPSIPLETEAYEPEGSELSETCLTCQGELKPIDALISFMLTGEHEYAEEALPPDLRLEDMLIPARELILARAEEEFGQVTGISYEVLSINETARSGSLSSERELELKIIMETSDGQKEFVICPRVVKRESGWYISPVSARELIGMLNKLL